jgi:hypothetical protein
MRGLAMATMLAVTMAACSGAAETESEAGGAAAPTPPPAAAEPEGAEPAGSATEPATSPTGVMPEPDVTLTAVDYAYEDVPETIAAGSVISLANQGEEPHELVAFHIPDDETRAIEELLALPEGSEPPVEFAGVVVALTDGEVFHPEGAPVTLTEPGRYAFVCFLPTGITDEQIRQIAASTGPGEEPSFPAGAPHFTQGMWTEVTVE